MTALADSRLAKDGTIKNITLTLAAGTKAYEGGIACIERATGATKGQAKPSAASLTLVPIGRFLETVDATLAAKPVVIELQREVLLAYYSNAASPNAVAASDIGGDCYLLDDQTVTADPTGHAVAGRVWVVDATRGVGVEWGRAHPTTAAQIATGGATAYQVVRVASDAKSVEIGDARSPAGAALSYTANAAAPAAIQSGATYDVPTTAAASTITLPTAASDGTYAYFAADGTKNGHTVQYIDQSGPTNLTTALTASKRHLVVAVKLGGKWFANAYISP